MAALTKRYDEEETKNTVTEQEQWELDQQRKARAHFGAVKKTKEDKQYELLLENQVEFIQSSILAGISEAKASRLKKKIKRGRSKSASSSESSGDEEMKSEISDSEIKLAEKLLSPEEKKRLDLQ